jgi:hypothetical protein
MKYREKISQETTQQNDEFKFSCNFSIVVLRFCIGLKLMTYCNSNQE